MKKESRHLIMIIVASVVGILTFPFYSILGILGVIPYFIYNVVLLMKNK